MSHYGYGKLKSTCGKESKVSFKDGRDESYDVAKLIAAEFGFTFETNIPLSEYDDVQKAKQGELPDGTLVFVTPYDFRIFCRDTIKRHLNMKDTRNMASTYAYQVARDIEALLEYMNRNEQAFCVNDDDDAVIFEEDMHAQIATYMRLGKSFETRDTP